MRPRKDDEAFVDVLDVLLRDGAILRADVIVSVAEVPLVGIKLTAAIAGMETMTDYGLFEEWDASRRNAAVSRRQYARSKPDRDRPTFDELDVSRSYTGADEKDDVTQ
ncbi:gas vesicle protein GvpA/GvpJ/GvpM family [Natrinema hispanicum]|uniref:Gas vesicle protein GvpA/GvpJ/GvpM family n=1 Tax=Natrinema hispanicum TaxID=392421 RepID=A0A482Y5C6_9EURY|nr:gas vesicle protein [Natrinema hispanicum]RZV10303.1 gas vesicle protein GvpA/GvpJ/GvpM family [Natrinema hispanicum]